MLDSDLLHQTLMAAPIGICLLEGPEHIFILANPAYKKIFYEIKHDIIGMPARKVRPELLNQGFIGFLDKVYTTGESISDKEALIQVPQGDGTVKNCFVSFTYQARRDSKNQIIGVMVSVLDVTSQVEAKKNLEESAKLLRMITDRLPAFVSYMDKNRRYRFVNNIYANWFEKPRSEIEGKTRQELVNNSLTYDFMKPYENRAFEGEAVSFALTLTKPDGRFVNLDTEFLPDIDPFNGKVLGIIGVGQDVTEHKRALLAIEASENRFRSLTDTIPQLMWTCSANGQVNYVNERCLHYTGLTNYEKYGNSWIHTIHPEDVAGVSAAWQQSMIEKSAFKYEYRIRRFDGEYRWFLGSAIPIKTNEGMILYWIGTATDIEDQKKIAEELRVAKEIAEEASATKSAFLANMSHEIRTPLGAILGFSSLLKDPHLSADERLEYIDAINRNGQSLTRIIDDILDLAKVEAGQLDVEEIDFSFVDLLNEVMTLFKEKARQKKIDLTLNVAERVPTYISSDPTRLRQILINIIGNAVKFTDTGGVVVSVHARQDALTRALKVAVEVKDTGCGLTREQNARLFKPFTQADNTTTRRFGGTGLGLALSKRLSEALGGDIRVTEYAPNQGCTFVINFVARVSKVTGSLTTPLPPFDRERRPIQRLRDVKILLVDDSIDNQFLVKHILLRNGAEVEVAGNGREAIEKATAENFDIVLMDIQMPEVDGYQATAALLEKGYKTPIIALTAHAMLEERSKTQAAGFAGHLTKPLNKEELLQTIFDHTRKINTPS